MKVRSLPARPSLELDKKAAKRLLRAARERDPAALARIAEGHPRFAAASDIDVDALRLADVELVQAREYGFPSWPRYKHFVDALLSDRATRAATLTRAVCGNQLSRGQALLEREPDLAASDFHVACACGELAFVRQALAREPGLAARAGGPEGWQPLVYTCFSRFWRRDAGRAERLLAIARLLLERGADPNGHYFSDHEGESEALTCLFAAAGIANHPELTSLRAGRPRHPDARRDSGARLRRADRMAHRAGFALARFDLGRQRSRARGAASPRRARRRNLSSARRQLLDYSALPMFVTRPSAGLGKPAAYRDLNQQLAGLLADERDGLANAANMAALLYQALPDLNWAGFYFLRGETLLLGPFQGKVACVRIDLGRGVCGTAARERRTIVVPDVHAFPGHIACDAASRSEIVVPLLHGENLYGVLDLDSPLPGRFDQDDADGLGAAVQLLLAGSDMSRL